MWKRAAQYTDELRSYNGLAKAGFAHRAVNHGIGQYVDKGSHVNSIEGFWSRLKLVIRRTHVHVSRHHLLRYVKEFGYRDKSDKGTAFLPLPLLRTVRASFPAHGSSRCKATDPVTRHVMASEYRYSLSPIFKVVIIRTLIGRCCRTNRNMSSDRQLGSIK